MKTTNVNVVQRSSIFNPRAYELSGGVIIDFDPAADSRRRARERQAARIEAELRREREIRRAIKRRSLAKQRLLAVAMTLFTIILVIFGFWMEEMWTAAAMSGLLTLPLYNKKYNKYLAI